MINPNIHSLHILAFVLLMRAQSFGLNTDGLLLLSFKFSIISDPLGVLRTWDYQSDTPCSWNGVTCAIPGPEDPCFRVTSLSLPNSGLSGSIPSTVGMIQHLQNLNLSSNSINGSIPLSLLAAPNLQTLDLSNNLISGGLPELIGNLQNLQLLNLSGNSMTGKLPTNLTRLRNLTSVSLRSNHFQGPIPSGFNSVRALDLSSNSINGPLPPGFGGGNIAYLNLSFNMLAGEIPAGFSAQIPTNATVDISYNNLTGPIPEPGPFLNSAGNAGLCGKPLKNPCPIPSSVATPPFSPPAIAVIPKTETGKSVLKTGTILGIVIGDFLGIVILSLIFGYIYHRKKRKRENDVKNGDLDSTSSSSSSSSVSSSSKEYTCLRTCTCLKRQKYPRAEEVRTTETIKTLESSSTIVTLDGGKEIEVETLLKASAYILGASGSSIMYKAVLEDGTTLAVRRVGEGGFYRFRDFETQIRVIAKLVHPNLVPVRGFYWGADEKLIIYDFLPNGSLANARHNRKAAGPGSSPCHLPFETRLKIARGVARGLCYIHDKKHVHGNLKPSNILLGLDMEPKIGDFGLERLVTTGDNSSKAGGSARNNFGSKRSTASRDDLSPSPSEIGVSPYHAPESLRSLKPNPKWDVFAFGVVMLDLLTGKIVLEESGPGLAIGSATSATDEDKIKVLRMADVAIRADVEGMEDELLGLLKLGYGCVSHVPQKRPSMKEVVHALDRFFPCSSNFGHL